MPTDNVLVKPQRDSEPLTKPHLRSVLTSMMVFAMLAVLTVASTLLAQRVTDREIEVRLTMQSEAVVASILTGVELVDVRLVALGGVVSIL